VKITGEIEVRIEIRTNRWYAFSIPCGVTFITGLIKINNYIILSSQDSRNCISILTITQEYFIWVET
jgi:hypothetical protein